MNRSDRSKGQSSVSGNCWMPVMCTMSERNKRAMAIMAYLLFPFLPMNGTSILVGSAHNKL